MVEKPKKKGIAIIISVGGKPPKSPADTSIPDMKKYGADPMKKAWNMLKSNTLPIKPEIMQYTTDPKNYSKYKQTAGVSRSGRRKLMDDFQARYNDEHTDESDIMNQKDREQTPQEERNHYRQMLEDFQNPDAEEEEFDDGTYIPEYSDEELEIYNPNEKYENEDDYAQLARESVLSLKNGAD